MEVRPADPLQGRFWLHDAVGAGNKILRSGDPDKKHRSTPAGNNAGQIELLSPGYGVPEKKICPDLPLCRHIEGHGSGLLPEGGGQDEGLRPSGSFESSLPWLIVPQLAHLSAESGLVQAHCHAFFL